jgi:hypothetical protein
MVALATGHTSSASRQEYRLEPLLFLRSPDALTLNGATPEAGDTACAVRC